MRSVALGSLVAPRRIAVVAAAGGLALAACSVGHAFFQGKGPPFGHRDLWIEGPSIHSAAGTSSASDLRGTVATLDDRRLRGLRLLPQHDLVWRLDLGREPKLRGRLWQTAGCRLRVEVAADAQPSQILLDQVLAPPDQDAPAYFPGSFVSLDLGPWAEQQVELRLSTKAEGGLCQDAWLLTPSLIEQRPHARMSAPPAPQGPTRPNVVLLTVDTLRADQLGAWGHQPSLTPALDRLAARADVFSQAFATINNTNPSFISLMTGLHPKNHQIYDLVTPLPEEHVTLAERFAQAGYTTRAVVAATHLGTSSGLRQGIHGLEQPWGQFYGETVVNQALDWLQRPERMPEPFFLWIHLFDPHVPHNPPLPFARGLSPLHDYGLAPVERWRERRAGGLVLVSTRPPRYLKGDPALYADEVAYIDRQIERLLTALADAQLMERTHLAFVADHGETLGERGAFFDHTGLHANTTQVPLMVLPAGQQKGRRLDYLVQHFDLFPTLLRLAQLPVPDADAIDARDLYALAPNGRNAVFASHAQNTGAAVRTPRFLYYRNERDPLLPIGAHFYDLSVDRQERHNLAGRNHPEEARLSAALDRFLADRRDGPVPSRGPVSDEERAQLEALGYIQ